MTISTLQSTYSEDLFDISPSVEYADDSDHTTIDPKENPVRSNDQLTIVGDSNPLQLRDDPTAHRMRGKRNNPLRYRYVYLRRPLRCLATGYEFENVVEIDDGDRRPLDVISLSHASAQRACDGNAPLHGHSGVLSRV